MIDRRSLIAGAVAGLVAGTTRGRADGRTSVGAPESTAPHAGEAGAQTGRSLADVVRDRERAFADAMAKRDFAAFASFLSREAIFFDGNAAAKGRDAVLEAWKPLFDGPTAPFAWTPDLVEVTESGTMAITSGPVLDAKGRRTSRFNSIWRLEPDGQWRVLFDRGCPAARC